MPRRPLFATAAFRRGCTKFGHYLAYLPPSSPSYPRPWRMYATKMDRNLNAAAPARLIPFKDKFRNFYEPNLHGDKLRGTFAGESLWNSSRVAFSAEIKPGSMISLVQTKNRRRLDGGEGSLCNVRAQFSPRNWHF